MTRLSDVFCLHTVWLFGQNVLLYVNISVWLTVLFFFLWSSGEWAFTLPSDEKPRGCVQKLQLSSPNIHLLEANTEEQQHHLYSLGR